MTKETGIEVTDFVQALEDFFDWVGDADAVELEDVRHKGGDKWTATFRKKDGK